MYEPDELSGGPAADGLSGEPADGLPDGLPGSPVGGPFDEPAAQAGPLTLGPADGPPRLWLVRVAEHRRLAHRLAPALLDGAERDRAASFRRPADRDLYVTAHVALRRLLGRYLDRDPAGIRLQRLPCPGCGQPHGRPAAAGAPLHFSLSHSDGIALLAFAATPVGVDVEALPAPDVVTDVLRTLHPEEADELRALPPARRPEAFTRVWTRKEAYLKGLGIGLARNPSDDYVGTGPVPPALPGWTVTDVRVPDGYGGAVAVAAP
ncbi:4'-phosphopantetheinyl transferase superfamily protein [Streptomyces sp. TRM 70351]|uniref:4'-phosphopantetheinyl transferase family protein n=1 Tax=Streptomyces sp. TRM 70351 TaxID=3116552 RepID=UPI002E7C3AA6|nr:4'-phosphopantetheinyl transferase superfamily protein [Streptomyces sp. TRM 70351]MEE1930237.1 4'-phosphopantetheinyl transferase superfamily protein [Streptomyces sp. TRM 70351]